MKIATYNVNGVRGRLANVLAWLEAARPDVVCLQELKAPDGAFPRLAFEAAGYGAVWHGQSSWNGVAILARDYDPIETRRGLPDDPDESQSRYIEAAVRGVLIGCLYAPNGNPHPGAKFDYKLKWYAALSAHAAELFATQAPVCLVGDFNIIPTDADVYAPDRWRDDALFRTEVREVYQDLLDAGWLDAVRTAHPDEQVFTFWDYLRNAWNRNAGLRLDHLLLNRLAAARFEAAGVDTFARAEDHSSDHAPAWAILGEEPPPAKTGRTRPPGRPRS